MKSTIRASTATWMVFAAVLAMSLAPLWAEEPTESGATSSGPTSPSTGKGEGVVNVPSMPEPNESPTGEFGAEGCRVISTMTLSNGGVVLQLPAESPMVVATYEINKVLVTTTLQEGLLHFDAVSLEAMRAEKVVQVDIILAASEKQYVRARLELPSGTDQVTVRIE